MLNKEGFYLILLALSFLRGYYMQETTTKSSATSCEELQRNIILHVENYVTEQLAIEHEKIRMEMKNEIEHLRNDILKLKEEMSQIILNGFSRPTEEISTSLRFDPKTTAVTSSFNETHNCIDNCGDIEKLPQDCAEVFIDHNKTNGVYVLKPLKAGQQPYGAFCTLFKNQSWTVIQRRLDGSVDFYRDWQSYKNGFGNLTGEYWLGLERIHLLTDSQKYKLWIEMKTYDDKVYNAFYDEFFIGNETKGYQLWFTDLKGNVEGKFSNLHGIKFSTYDRDNDGLQYDNCAKSYRDAWWFDRCGPVNLNGEYKPVSQVRGLWWYTGSEDLSLKYVTMSIHPA